MEDPHINSRIVWMEFYFVQDAKQDVCKNYFMTKWYSRSEVLFNAYTHTEIRQQEMAHGVKNEPRYKLKKQK